MRRQNTAKQVTAFNFFYNSTEYRAKNGNITHKVIKINTISCSFKHMLPNHSRISLC